MKYTPEWRKGSWRHSVRGHDEGLTGGGGRNWNIPWCIPSQWSHWISEQLLSLSKEVDPTWVWVLWCKIASHPGRWVCWSPAWTSLSLWCQNHFAGTRSRERPTLVWFWEGWGCGPHPDGGNVLEKQLRPCNHFLQGKARAICEILTDPISTNHNLEPYSILKYKENEKAPNSNST